MKKIFQVPRKFRYVAYSTPPCANTADDPKYINNPDFNTPEQWKMLAECGFDYAQPIGYDQLEEHIERSMQGGESAGVKVFVTNTDWSEFSLAHLIRQGGTYEEAWARYENCKEEMKKHLPDGIEAKVIPYDPYLSVIDEHIMLLTCNVLIFSAGSPDPIQLRDLVRLYKKKGYEKNEIKDYLEFYLTYSSNNLYKVINEANAIDELLELFNQGALTKTALQSFGALSTEQQKLAYAKIIKEGIEKVDQELANQIKKQIKESTKNPGSTEASAAFIKYDKILNSEIKDIEKALSLKLETMNYNELSHSITKLKLLSEKVNKLIFTSEKALNEKKK